MEQLSFEITAELRKLNKGLDRASAKIDNFAKINEDRLKKFGENATRLGKNLSVGLSLPIVALGAASIKAASDFEETESKFNTVFSNISNKANQTAESLRESFGLSRTAALELLGDTGDLLTGFGFTQQSALELSDEVNKLAVDLASFTNFSGGAEGASKALTKALLGERESVKSLGISILEADVQAKVLKNTQEGLTFETERQAKAYATLQIAQEQSKNAIGDYARTNQSFANQMRLIKARVSDLGVEFGKILLPIARKLLKSISGIVDRFSKLDESTKKIIVVVAALAAAAGPLLLVIGGIASALPAILSGLSLLMGPVGLIIAAIGALTVVVIKNWDTITAWAEDLVNFFIKLYNESIIFRAAVENLIFQFKTIFNVGKFVFKGLWTIIKTQFNLIAGAFKGLGDIILGVLTFDGEKIKSGLDSIVNNVVETGTKAIQELSGSAEELFNNVKDDFNDSIDNVLNGERKPVSFKAAEESKEQLKNDVKQAVQQGVQEGLGRARTSAVASESFSQGAITQAPQGANAGAVSTFDQADLELFNIEQRLLEFSNTANDIIKNNVANAFVGLGEVIGNALSGGGNVLQGFGQVLLGTMGNMLQQLGQQAIVLGLTLEAVFQS